MGYFGEAVRPRDVNFRAPRKAPGLIKQSLDAATSHDPQRIERMREIANRYGGLRGTVARIVLFNSEELPTETSQGF